MANVRQFLSAMTALAVAGGLLAFSATYPSAATEPAPENLADAMTVTASEVDLVPVATDQNFQTPRALSRMDADVQLEDVLEASESATEEETNGGIARVTLNSDIAIVGVTWDANSTNPTSVELRRLENGEWTAWQHMVLEETPDFVDPDALQLTGTHPVTLTNVEAVEVIAHDEDDRIIEGITVNVIDPRGAAPVDNDAEREPGEEELPEVELEEDLDNDADVGEETQTEESELPAEENSPVEPQSEEELTGDELLDLDGVAETEPSAFSSPLVAKLSSNGNVWDTGMNGLKVTTRKGWGAIEAHRKGFEDIQVKYKGAVVHHTEGSNNYTQAQVAGQIQGIYYYHAVTLDWGDIGYQFLVDKFGGVWEGRYGTLTRSPRGAQAYGANSETFGISVLGSYMTAAPPKVAEDAVAKTIAWQFKERGITNPKGTIQVPGSDLKGRTVNTISAHRDIGATDCPGDAFYKRMPQIRNAVVEYSKVTPTPKPPVVEPNGWNAGNVISDASFYNPNTMTESQIQAFLNKEGANCKPGSGTSCLKDKKFPTKKLTTLRGGCKPLNLSGNQSAARIINETSKACGINPQVILATLQKEQSGITQPKTDATWAKAMGAGCPDGQPCDSTLGGFAQQVYYGADKLVSYRINATWEQYILAYEAGKPINIRHNPDPKCGTQSVKIQNYATASLYMYTPYIGASKVAGCTSVGAKSFYDIMNRWFPGSLGSGVAPAPKPDPSGQTAVWQQKRQIGSGWSSNAVYPGDWNQDSRQDLMLIDKSGILWFYRGLGQEKFAKKVRIGRGWHVMDKVIGGVDWDGDGKPDLLARVRSTGELRLYPGNGKGGFLAPKRVGKGWQVMKDITVARTPAGAAVYALDDSGRVFRYPAIGGGKFGSRTQVAGDWKGLNKLVAAKSWTTQGQYDLIGRKNDGQLIVYQSTGAGSFAAPKRIGTGWQQLSQFGTTHENVGRGPIWAIDPSGKLFSYRLVRYQ